MNRAFEPVTVRPDPALLAAVGERLAQVLASNRRLAQMPAINFQARRRIESVIAGLIEALDDLDGDCDLEAVSQYEGGQCDDEGQADFDGLAEQWKHQKPQGEWVVA